MKRIKTIILAIVACVLCLPITSVNAQEYIETDNCDSGKARSAVGSDVTIVPGKVHSYGSWSTNEFWVTTETGKYLGFCAEPTKTTTNGIYQVSKMQEDVIETLVLTYTIPELWEVFGREFYQTGNAYAFCHAAIGYIYTGELQGLSAQAIEGIKNLVAVVTHLVNGTAIYQGSEKTAWIRQYLEQYQLYIAHNSSQDIVWVEKEPEVHIDLNFLKVQEGTQIPLAGAKFMYIYENEEAKYFTTDETGMFTISDIQAGHHCIKEIEAPNGYLAGNIEIQFQVDRAGNIIVDSDTQSNRNILIDITSNNTSHKIITMTAQNKTVPYSLVIHKENENGIRLEGAEFALYYDRECTRELSSGTTDADGCLQFSDLENQVTYYLKEITAPVGYRLPTDENGNAVITEIRAHYIPISGELSWYVNGHEEQQNIPEENRQAPTITMTVVNEIGYALPQTGSSDGLKFLLLAGAIFTMSICMQIYDYREKRKSLQRKKKACEKFCFSWE